MHLFTIDNHTIRFSWQWAPIPSLVAALRSYPNCETMSILNSVQEPENASGCLQAPNYQGLLEQSTFVVLIQFWKYWFDACHRAATYISNTSSVRIRVGELSIYTLLKPLRFFVMAVKVFKIYSCHILIIGPCPGQRRHHFYSLHQHVFVLHRDAWLLIAQIKKGNNVHFL